MADTRHVKGLDQLQKLLDALPAKMEANIMRGGLRAGAMVMREEVRITAPRRTGTLAAGVKVSTRSRQGTVSAVVKTTGKHAYLAPWLEYGTAAHKITPKRAKSLFLGGMFVSGVDHPGSRPKPFMRPALDTKATAALVAVGEYVKKRLTKAGMDQASEVRLEVDE